MDPAIDDDAILTAARDALPEAQAIYLFGSRAEGAARGDSDLDLAVLMAPGKADPVGLWETGEALAARLGVDVDLVDLMGASTVLQHRIVTTGRRLFAADPLAADWYEAFIESEMADLNEARAPLLAEIAREGRVTFCSTRSRVSNDALPWPAERHC